MRILQANFYRSPFTSEYRDVPADYSATSDNNFKTKFRTWLNVNSTFSFVVGEEDIKAPRFSDNINDNITIKLPSNINLNNMRECNYVILFTDDEYNSGYRYFFVTNVTALNAMSEPSVSLSLTKDIWVENYYYVKQFGMPFNITRQHLNMIENGESSYVYQNLNVSGVPVCPTTVWTSERVVWAVFKLDPSVTYYDENHQSIGHYAPDAQYGTYQYIYYPAFVTSQGLIKPVRMYKGASAQVYIPRIYGTYLLSQQLTVNVPFDYTLSLDDSGYYYISSCTLSIKELYYSYGSDTYRPLDTWATDYSSEFYCYTSTTPSSIVTRRYVYTFDTSVSSNYYYILTSLDKSPYMQSYPFKYYTLTMPDGKEYSFEQTSPLKQIVIDVIPTDSGGYYTIRAYCQNQTYPLTLNGIYQSYEISSDVPRTASAYLDYLARAGNMMSEERRYAIQKQNYNASMATVEGTINIASGAVGLATGINVVPVVDSKSGQTTDRIISASSGAGIDSSVGAIVKGGTQIASGISGSSIEKKHINNTYNAKIADLANTTITRAQKSNQLNTAPYYDLPVVTLFTVLDTAGNTALQNTFIKYGTECNRVSDPMIDYRKFFNYVKVVNPNYTNIGNEVMRATINAILATGVTKWDISNYNSGTLNYYVQNTQK